MAGINKVIVVGNVGKDPETNYTQSGSAVTKFSVATSRQWKDKQTGEKREETEWHRMVAFGKLADICGKYLSKGKQVYIEGHLKTNSWEQDGVTRYATDIVVDQMQMLGGVRREDKQGAPSGYSPTPDDDDSIPF